MGKYTSWSKNINFELLESYLDTHVFYGLHDLNTGFDVEGIRYFSEKEFEIVLHRVEALGLGIFGIEPWKEGRYYDVLCYEELSGDATEPAWYYLAFEEFKSRGLELQYSATYYVPEQLIKAMMN